MSLRHVVGRRRLAAAALILAAALSASSGAVLHDQASAATGPLPAGCGPVATGAGPEIVTQWRGSGCPNFGLAWQNVTVGKSSDGQWTALFQTDGNLVVYYHLNFPDGSGYAAWWSATPYTAFPSIWFMADGNMTIHQNASASSVTLWSSSNYFGAYGTMRLYMQNDGNLVIYNGNMKPYWSSNTGVLYA